MNVKINNEKLRTFLSGDNKNAGNFEKHLVQEGVKFLLYEDDVKPSMKTFLEDLEIIEESSSDEKCSFDENKPTYIKEVMGSLNREIAKLIWDYKELSNPKFFGTQKDWNQTLISTIDEVSDLINKNTKEKGEKLIIIHPDLYDIVNDLEHFYLDYKEYNDFIYFGTIKTKYTMKERYMFIASRTLVKPNQIIICNGTFCPDEPYEPGKPQREDNPYGTITILNAKNNDK